MRIYLDARRTPHPLSGERRVDYWLASACNGLAGAIHHLAVLFSVDSPEEARHDLNDFAYTVPLQSSSRVQWAPLQDPGWSGRHPLGHRDQKDEVCPGSVTRSVAHQAMVLRRPIEGLAIPADPAQAITRHLLVR